MLHHDVLKPQTAVERV